MTFKTHIIGTLAAFSILAGCAADGATGSGEDNVVTEQALTIENFASHPRIVEVREIVKQVDEGIAKNAITKHERDLASCEGPVAEFAREKYVDAGGKVRKLVQRFGSDHGVWSTTSYYGPNGKLRFVFEVSDSSVGEEPNVFFTLHEKRAYFNAAGQVFWEVDRRGDGEGTPPDLTKSKFEKPEAPFEPTDPAVETDPARAFDAPPHCP